ncbi:formate/nitrite transporter family protein [Dickeya dadantii]|uniref:formate/nitrite transporter family protein n=1 Tax=Dickeya dadantii TaxID=204038 RepID=UPI001C0C694A|nr:formate/nitrite transporter family protein [Dickeya dadantii]QWT40605.1 formate/nitrite transporter family protein [Dickeya dadantii]
MKADNPFTLLLPPAMAKVAEDAGVYKATKQPLTAFFLAITAGVFISIAFVFYITATTGSSSMPYGMAKLVGGICFSMGLMLVVVCGADLFTSTVLTVIAKARGPGITGKQLGMNWLNVYVGNLIGALFFVALILVFPAGSWKRRRRGAECIADRQPKKLEHSFVEAFVPWDSG